jgi:tRNA threonylcarbamoyladenosine biosynthesis protein TsaB
MKSTTAPLILAIETATGCGSVALTRGSLQQGRVVVEAAVHTELSHSRQLLASLAWVMQAAGVTWQEVEAVAVSLGPGSFTGLRIGLATAKGLVFATGKPLISVPSLAAVALSCPLVDSPLWCLMDARKQEVYAACYRWTAAGLPEACGPIQALRPELLVQQLVGPALIAGPGLLEYYDIFSQQSAFRCIPPALSSPSAAKIGFLAAEYLHRGEYSDPASTVPLYVRASEAEVNLKKKLLSAHDPAPPQ